MSNVKVYIFVFHSFYVLLISRLYFHRYFPSLYRYYYSTKLRNEKSSSSSLELISPLYLTLTKLKKNFENNISIFIDSNIAYSIVYYSTVHKIIRKELRNPIRDISKESNVNKYCRRSNCRIESSGGPRVTVRAERVNKRNFNECYSLIRTIGRRTP